MERINTNNNGNATVKIATNKMENLTAKKLELPVANTYHFGLYYHLTPHNGGLNIKRAKSGYSIQNLILNAKDVETLESFLSQKGILGLYAHTKSKNWARCQNVLSRTLMVELTKYLRSNKIQFGR